MGPCDSFNRERSGEGWLAVAPGWGGWRMTGSAQTRSEAVRFILLLGEKKKGEGLGEERARHWAGREAGG